MFKNSWNRFLDFLFYSDDLPSVYLPRMRETERLMKIGKANERDERYKRLSRQDFRWLSDDDQIFVMDYTKDATELLKQKTDENN